MTRPRHSEVAVGNTARVQQITHGFWRAVHQREKEEAGPSLPRRLVEVNHFLHQIPRTNRAGVDEHRPGADAEPVANTNTRRGIEAEVLEIDARRNDAPRW